jgi:hypothetical protein
MPRFLTRLPLLSVLSCTPQWADRAALPGEQDAAPADSAPPPTAADRPADVSPDRSAERLAEVRPSDRTPPFETVIAADAGSEPPPDASRPPAAVLVVDDALAPTEGDGELLSILAAAGLRVQLATDSSPTDLAGVDLVVLAASCLAATLGDRYRDLPLPVISMEPAVFDDLGMTGPVSGIDWEETVGLHVDVVAPEHPVAAGLAGPLAVVSEPATLTWGRPAPSAQLVATFEGIPDRAAIFLYSTRAEMVVGRAPARRVGFFAADLAASRLTPAGAALLRAAVRWALR